MGGARRAAAGSAAWLPADGTGGGAVPGGRRGIGAAGAMAAADAAAEPAVATAEQSDDDLGSPVSGSSVLLGVAASAGGSGTEAPMSSGSMVRIHGQELSERLAERHPRRSRLRAWLCWRTSEPELPAAGGVRSLGRSAPPVPMAPPACRRSLIGDDAERRPP